MKPKIILFLAFVSLLFLLVSCSSSTTLSCPQGQKLVGKSCVPTTICGDNLCESAESYQICAKDCERQCESRYCNNQVQIVCTQNNCERQEQLFSNLLTLQSRVASCLTQYFTYTPPRITYEIEVESGSTCTQEDGCCCSEGGLTSVHGVQTSFNGLTIKGQSSPTTAQDLLADEHETTHFFLNHMLGPHPSWFSEAIAIQTNERAGCDSKVLTNANPQVYEYSLRGDAFLLETPADKKSYGVKLDDGSYLNTTYYYKLKKGTSRLSNNDQYDPHIIGTLWIIGLKEEYGCTDKCIKDILKELRTYAQNQFTIHKNCEGQIVTNKAIYDATKKVLGKDPYALFQLLDIKRYNPTA